MASCLVARGQEIKGIEDAKQGWYSKIENPKFSACAAETLAFCVSSKAPHGSTGGAHVLAYQHVVCLQKLLHVCYRVRQGRGPCRARGWNRDSSRSHRGDRGADFRLVGSYWDRSYQDPQLHGGAGLCAKELSVALYARFLPLWATFIRAWQLAKVGASLNAFSAF